MNQVEFNEIKESFQGIKAKKEGLQEHIATMESNYAYHHSRASSAEKARLIFQEVAKITQRNLEFHISTLVTTAIRSVYPNEIEFVVKFEDRRNKTECDLLFKEYGEEYKPLDGAGHGVVDVAVFALRVAFWSLKKNRPTMILDESFRNVSPDLQYKVSDMLQMMSTKLGIQIIMVSHQDEVNISADKTFIVSKKGKISSIKEQ